MLRSECSSHVTTEGLLLILSNPGLWPLLMDWTTYLKNKEMEQFEMQKHKGELAFK